MMRKTLFKFYSVRSLVKLPSGVNRGNSAHNSLMNPLLLAQMFGLMPVLGICAANPECLEFKWLSLRTGYAILRFLGALFVTSIQITKMASKEVTLPELRLLVFFLFGIASSINFFCLARKWPRLMKKWNTLELSLMDYGWPRHLNKTVNLYLTIYLVAAILEHLLEVIHKIIMITHCSLDFPDSLRMFLKHLTLNDAFTVIEYSIFWGVLLEIISILLTFSWTFIDIFIILISVCLTARFSQVTSRVNFLVRSKVDDARIWEKIRNDYCKLCHLCRLLDDVLSSIILQSFASNLFFILIQLFNTFQNRAYFMEKAYFSFSFSTLILRMFLVCLIGGKIKEESSKPLITLSGIPTLYYIPQIQRFAEYIYWNNTAFTGKHYFTITKGLVLHIAGAVITYELVLLQFSGHTLTSSENNETQVFNCNNP